MINNNNKNNNNDDNHLPLVDIRINLQRLLKNCK